MNPSGLKGGGSLGGEWLLQLPRGARKHKAVELVVTAVRIQILCTTFSRCSGKGFCMPVETIEKEADLCA